MIGTYFSIILSLLVLLKLSTCEEHRLSFESPKVIDEANLHLSESDYKAYENKLHNLLQRYSSSFNADELSYQEFHVPRLAVTFATLEATGILHKDTSVLCLGEKKLIPIILHDLFGVVKITSNAVDTTGLTDILKPDGTHFQFEINQVNIEVDDWPYDSQTFDLILCLETLEHLKFDPMKVSLEANRVLKSENGYFLVTTPNSASYRSVLNVLRGDIPVNFPSFQMWGNDLVGIAHPREWGINDIRLWGRKSGFSVHIHNTFSPYKFQGTEAEGQENTFRKYLEEVAQWSTGISGSTHFLLLKKTHAPQLRYYEPLYWTGGRHITFEDPYRAYPKSFDALSLDKFYIPTSVIQNIYLEFKKLAIFNDDSRMKLAKLIESCAFEGGMNQNYVSVHSYRWDYSFQKVSKLIDFLHYVKSVPMHQMKILGVGESDHIPSMIWNIYGIKYSIVNNGISGEITLKRCNKLFADKSKNHIKLKDTQSILVDQLSADGNNKFPYPDRHFHIVTMLEVLEHLRDHPMKALAEINRVLKINGHLVLTTPNGNAFNALLNIYRDNSPLTYSPYDDYGISHVKEYSIQEMRGLMKHSGFHIVEHSTISPYRMADWDLDEKSKYLLALSQLHMGKNVSMMGHTHVIIAKKKGPPKSNKFTPLYNKDE